MRIPQHAPGQRDPSPVRRDEGSSPTIAAALLMPQDRMARTPLARWAEQLLAAMSNAGAAIRETRPLAEKLGSVGNNTGLIAALRGEMQTAWSVTERQVWWLGRLARRSGDPAVAAHAVQPWVNLGRLEALNGNWREALARFEALSTYDVAGQLQIGCMRLRESAWSGISSSRELFVNFLQIVYVTDSLKAMLLNRRFELIHPFTAAVGATGVLRWMSEEACVVADSVLGDHRAAISQAGAAARDASGWQRAVLRLRLAEAHACAGEVERAREILVGLAGVIRQVSPEVKAKPELMPVTARVAGACHEVGLADDACAVARDVLAGARTARDEMIEIEMLKLLAAASPDDEAEGWRDAAKAAVDATDYARFRRGAPPRPNPVFDELYERLEAVYT